MTTYEHISYDGWTKCARLANKQVELIITGEVGPRIIRFGFLDRDNLFKEYPEQVGKVGGDAWRIYGGHRLWHAPESLTRTYYPDNCPIHFDHFGTFLRVTQNSEPTTGIQKQMDITLAPGSAHVTVVHRLVNHNLWPIELVPWALSVMNASGTAIIPMPPRGTHDENLLPTHTMTFWAYTDMSDPRWTWGRKYILLRQDTNAKVDQKLGMSVPDGWAAYARDGNLFIKSFAYKSGAKYPDNGSSVEVYTNDDMLELETLGPVITVAPESSVEHIENWYLFDNVTVPTNDDGVDQTILPLVQSIQRMALIGLSSGNCGL